MLTYAGGRYGGYSDLLPVPNVKMIPILTVFEIWIFHITGMGSTSIATSVRTFMTDLHRYHAFMLIQWPPGMVLFHRNSRGIQTKNPAPIAPTQFATVRAPITQHAIRSLRLVKMRRYRTKIASFGKTTAGMFTMGIMRVYFAQTTRVEGEDLTKTAQWYPTPA